MGSFKTFHVAIVIVQLSYVMSIIFSYQIAKVCTDIGYLKSTEMSQNHKKSVIHNSISCALNKGYDGATFIKH